MTVSISWKCDWCGGEIEFLRGSPTGLRCVRCWKTNGKERNWKLERLTSVLQQAEQVRKIAQEMKMPWTEDIMLKIMEQSKRELEERK